MGGILSGTIDCPPRSRLEGFAELLGVSVNRLIRAAEDDGCSNYDNRFSAGEPEMRFAALDCEIEIVGQGLRGTLPIR